MCDIKGIYFWFIAFNKCTNMDCRTSVKIIKIYIFKSSNSMGKKNKKKITEKKPIQNLGGVQWKARHTGISTQNILEFFFFY